MPKKQNKSARQDGRGGWIPGKRRNQDVGDWSRLRIDLAALFADAWDFRLRTPTRLARDLGVSEKTVRRWISGEDRPAPESQEAVRVWLSEARKQVKLETKARAT
jgi:predicted transcriptional regulator